MTTERNGGSRLHMAVTEYGPTEICVTVAGEVDASNIHIFRSKILDALRSKNFNLLTLDLARLDFIDVLGISAMHQLHVAAAASGCMLIVSHADERTLRISSVLGFAHIFGEPTGWWRCP